MINMNKKIKILIISLALIVTVGSIGFTQTIIYDEIEDLENLPPCESVVYDAMKYESLDHFLSLHHCVPPDWFIKMIEEIENEVITEIESVEDPLPEAEADTTKGGLVDLQIGNIDPNIIDPWIPQQPDWNCIDETGVHSQCTD